MRKQRKYSHSLVLRALILSFFRLKTKMKRLLQKQFWNFDSFFRYHFPSLGEHSLEGLKRQGYTNVFEYAKIQMDAVLFYQVRLHVHSDPRFSIGHSTPLSYCTIQQVPQAPPTYERVHTSIAANIYTYRRHMNTYLSWMLMLLKFLLQQHHMWQMAASLEHIHHQ